MYSSQDSLLNNAVGLRVTQSIRSWGMLVYWEDTSMDARRQFLGTLVVSTNSLDSFRYEGRFLTTAICQQKWIWVQ